MLTKQIQPDAPEGPNAEMIRYWNQLAGPTWAALEPKISAQIRPFGLLALAAAGIEAGHRVLDVGCGGGDTTVEIGRRVGPGGAVTGVDISEVMLAIAGRAAHEAALSNVRFLLADAQTANLPQTVFDVVFSRFGVMFFADPVAAFGNLRRALVPGGRLAFVCWRAARENEWMRIPAEAASRHIEMPSPEPHAPGPCALADADRTRRLLSDAGFADVSITAADQRVSLGEATTLEEAVDFLFQVGPVARALREAPPEKAGPLREALLEALAPHATGAGVSLDGASWIVTARSPEAGA